MDHINQKDGVTSYYKREELALYKHKIEIFYTNIKSLKSKLYKSLQTHCNLHFFSKESPVNLEYLSDYKLFAFAISSKCKYYVTIGGIGDTDYDYYSIGVMYKDKCFMFADNIKEFLSIMAYYPFWDELVGCSYVEINNIIKKYFSSHNFNCRQKELLQLFKFNVNVDVLPKILNNINNPQYINLYKL